MKTTALLAAFAAATAAATCPDLTSQLEDLGEGALPMKESSGTSSDFATKGGTVAYGAEGAVGGAVDFSQATTKNYLMAADDDDLDGFADFTIADEAAFSHAVVAAGADGLVVARELGVRHPRDGGPYGLEQRNACSDDEVRYGRPLASDGERELGLRLPVPDVLQVHDRNTRVKA